jgi:quinoprotein glucose dehydrogenase
MLDAQWLQWPIPSYRVLERPVAGPQGLPITKPPYGRVTAIDLKTGDTMWVVPMGDGPTKHPALRGLQLGRLGWPYRGFPLVTKSLLFIAQEGSTMSEHTSLRGNGVEATFSNEDPALQIFDKTSGSFLGKVALPSNATGSPLTYSYRGRQYIVLAVGGGNIPAELIALALPHAPDLNNSPRR